MGVRKKNKRKIIVNSREFYWYIGESEEYYGMEHINIVSEDKKFIVSYMIGQCDIESIKENYIIVKGQEFKNFKDVGGCWKRFSTPKWDYKIITPKLVAEIINWCFNDQPTYEVNYKEGIISTK